MNADQNKNQSKHKAKLNLALIPLEKMESPSIWQRMKMALTKSDLDIQGWEQLESKRIRQSSSEKWRNH